MDQVAAGLAIIVIGANIFGWFFLSTGRYQSEYEPKNKKVVAILFEEFHQKLEEIRLKEMELKIQGGEIESLYQDAKDLTEKFNELTEWKKHMMNGKMHLQHFASLALIAMILFGTAVVIFPSSDNNANNSTASAASVLIEVGVIAFLFSVANLWRYCAICRTIEAEVAEL